MFSIISIFNFALLLFGVFAIRTYRLPELIVGNKFKIARKSIRNLGFLMIIPSLLEFIFGFFVGYKSYGDNLAKSLWIEKTITIQVAVLIIILLISTIVIIGNAKPIKGDDT